jgi:hypothetical protein
VLPPLSGMAAPDVPGRCASCATDNSPGTTRCQRCGTVLPVPFDVDYSGHVWLRRRTDAPNVPEPRTGIPWWVYFWTGALCVWLAIAMIVLVGYDTPIDIAVISLVIVGPALISYSYYVLMRPGWAKPAP